MRNGIRHLIGLLGGLVAAPAASLALSYAAGLKAHERIGPLPADEKAIVAALMALVAVMLGTCVAPRVSPLASLLPGILLLALATLWFVDVHLAVQIGLNVLFGTLSLGYLEMGNAGVGTPPRCRCIGSCAARGSVRGEVLPAAGSAASTVCRRRLPHRDRRMAARTLSRAAPRRRRATSALLGRVLSVERCDSYVGGRDQVDGEAAVKAVVYDRYGFPDVLRVDDVPIPLPTAGQVRVKIAATSVNLSDWECLRGSPAYARIGGLRSPARRTLGSDIAGPAHLR